MKKWIFRFLCLCLLMTATCAAAEPMLTRAGYTAYIGQSNHLYLLEPEGTTKVMRHPMADLLSITDTHVYALAQDGRLLSIRLDGAETLIISAAPTAAEIVALLPAPTFELNNGFLSAIKANGSRILLSGSAVAAAANDERLYFIETAANSAYLKAVNLADIETDALVAPKVEVLGQGLVTAQTLTASYDGIGIVDQEHHVRVVYLKDNTQAYVMRNDSQSLFPADAAAVRAAYINGEVLCYAQDENGHWITQSMDSASMLQDTLTLQDERSAYTAMTITPTPVPVTPTPRPTATPKPTVKVTATPSVSINNEDDRLEYGDKGSEVRKMQKRLKALGYPVGSVDGTWGKNTQLAVNLFQCAAGYSERSYASERMLNKLYSSKAPKYDPYAPLKEGDKGTDVRLMQKALFDLGYLGTDEKEEVDGVYGKITTAAVLAFQKAVGDDVLKPTGNADADTLFILFNDNPPRNPELEQPGNNDPNYPEFITPENKPPVEPESPAEPIVPDAPEEPESPAEPIVPDTPEEPESPAEPIVPDTPEEPESPTEPILPDAPEEPESPAEPIVPDAPAEPESPAEPIVPDTPVEPESPAEPIVPDAPVEPESPAEPIVPDTPEDTESDSASTDDTPSDSSADDSLVSLIIPGQ